MTTFVTRETVRKALVAVFTATGKWDLVYGYQPSSFNDRASILTIRSGGTRWKMEGLHVNPSAYTMMLKSYLILDDSASWEADDCEDRIDELDRVVRQTLRDNAGTIGGADFLTVPEGESVTGFAIVSGTEYRTEEWEVQCHHVTGS